MQHQTGIQHDNCAVMMAAAVFLRYVRYIAINSVSTQRATTV